MLNFKRWQNTFLRKFSVRPVGRLIGRLACCLLVVLALWAETKSAEDSQIQNDGPNVLFIISDDLSAEVLKCYGNRQCETPNIDALAKRGFQFENAYCQYPVCGPSRAALMSGMYPPSIGVLGNGGSGRFSKVLGKRPSMSQVFKQNGIYTARVSKIYHMRVPGDITAGVDGPDHAASWTERFNSKAPEWYSKGERSHLSKEKLNFDKDKHYGLGFGTAFYVVKGDGDGTEQADVQSATKAIEIMEQKKDQRFFLAVGFVRPHVPLVAPKKYYEPYPPAKMTLPKKLKGDQSDIPKRGISKNSKSTGIEGNIARQKEITAAYYASVAFMDAQVGRLLKALDRLDLTKKTIVVFTADHGYHMGEHDLWQKMSLHEESVRIPILVSGPGVENGKSSSLAQQIDLFPTLVDLAGLKIPEHVQGKSLVPVLKRPEAKVHDEVLCFRGKGDTLLRNQNWSYIRYNDGSEELYDMKKDRQQYSNLATAPEYSDTKKRLSAKLQERLKALPVPAK